MNPSNTGIQWVTPSPASTNKAVIKPSANRDNKAYIPTYILPNPNFSNNTSAILILLFIGFITASVINIVSLL